MSNKTKKRVTIE